MKNLNTTVLMPLAMSTFLLLGACGGSGSGDDGAETPRDTDTETPSTPFALLQGSDLNRKSSPLLSFNPGGPGGSPNQSLRGGDILQATAAVDTIMIGALGVDVLVGSTGNDIMIGGTEDFNGNVDGHDRAADNRDRAFGNDGDDVFIWTPGDGSDFFDGGRGTDVLVLGLLGEERNSDGTTEGAPFFNVNPPGREGSQDFDGIFLDSNNQPTINVSASPGFCSVIAAADHPQEFELLDLDHLVRFSLTGVANDFDQGLRSDDDGLRIAINTKDVEYLVCTDRESGISVLDLTTTPATVADLSQIPAYVASMIQ